MDYNVFLLNLQNKVNKEDFFNLTMKFNNMDEAKRSKIEQNIYHLQLCDTLTPMIASIIAGCLCCGFLALDRFLIKDFMIGIIRLIFSLFIPLCFLCLACYCEDINEQDIADVLWFLCGISVFFAIIWWAADLFFVYKKVQKNNFNKINTFLNNF